MIRSLRRKFIAAAMVSVFAVLSVIIGSINVLNYRSVIREADSTLRLIQSFGGRFPTPGEREEFLPGIEPQFDDISPELPYQSRFFSVSLSGSGSVLLVDTAQIAAVDRDTAISMASSVSAGQSDRGFYGVYRYLRTVSHGTTRVIFLDCTRELDTVNGFLLVSLGASLAGMLAVWLLLIVLSKRFVQPVAESYEKQKRFITDAGHEIKTPITIIDADAELLEMELPDSEWLTDIRLQTRRLAELTNELIYLSRMDEGVPDGNFIEFPLSDLVQESASSFQALAITQGKEFSVTVEPQLALRGDANALRHLVGIVLDNALKYTPTGGSIRLSLKRSGRTVMLTVENTTDGLDPAELGRLFDRFYRTDRARNSGGYGLGLAIAQAVVQSHKGKITASTPDGIRMVMEIQLPVL